MTRIPSIAELQCWRMKYTVRNKLTLLYLSFSLFARARRAAIAFSSIISGSTGTSSTTTRVLIVPGTTNCTLY